MATELVPARPAGALRGVVLAYRGFQADAAAAGAEREPAAALVPLILEFGGGWRVSAPASGYRPARLGGFVAGLSAAYTLVEAAGPVAGVQVDLTPLGARRLLGRRPMHELADRAVGLEELLGSAAARELVDPLAAAASWGARFALLDAALGRRLGASEPPPGEIAWAWQQLVRRGGRLPIGHLVRELGWSRKRLVARFRDEIGVGPKTAARILRFSRLQRSLCIAGAGAPAWADLALAHGFADQAHLVREVRSLAGITPTALFAAARAHRD